MVEKGIETITKIFNAWIDIFIKNTWQTIICVLYYKWEVQICPFLKKWEIRHWHIFLKNEEVSQQIFPIALDKV
jgi:hypothetical protein